MKINKTNIKSILGITDTTYDTRISSIIPLLLNNISNYCNNDFLMINSTGRIYDNCDMSFSNYTVTLNHDLTLESDDFVRFYDTVYNDGLFQIESVASGSITMYSGKSFKTESTTSGLIALVEFPDEFIQIVANYIDRTIISNSNVSSEKIDDYQVNYFKPSNNSDFLSENISILSNYRKVFKERFVDIFEYDCVNR